MLTAFLKKEGFQVTQHFHLPTAWEAKFTHGAGGRTIGVNSEMDALPGVGHACGHNLIAISGVAVACALKDVLLKWNISGKIVLLGTPGKDSNQSYLDLREWSMTHRGSFRSRGRRSRQSRAPEQRSIPGYGHLSHVCIPVIDGSPSTESVIDRPIVPKVPPCPWSPSFR